MASSGWMAVSKAAWMRRSKFADGRLAVDEQAVFFVSQRGGPPPSAGTTRRTSRRAGSSEPKVDSTWNTLGGGPRWGGGNVLLVRATKRSMVSDAADDAVSVTPDTKTWFDESSARTVAPQPRFENTARFGASSAPTAEWRSQTRPRRASTSKCVVPCRSRSSSRAFRRAPRRASRTKSDRSSPARARSLPSFSSCFFARAKLATSADVAAKAVALVINDRNPVADSAVFAFFFDGPLIAENRTKPSQKPFFVPSF
mmetsp:Transcript_1608/g.5527  ORF Transcript_1608/g.5527 Transcript_1608/m.5527 type:complete len:256 (+) Transcript_1608:697-1464(+)